MQKRMFTPLNRNFEVGLWIAQSRYIKLYEQLFLVRPKKWFEELVQTLVSFRED